MCTRARGAIEPLGPPTRTPMRTPRDGQLAADGRPPAVGAPTMRLPLRAAPAPRSPGIRAPLPQRDDAFRAATAIARRGPPERQRRDVTPRPRSVRGPPWCGLRGATYGSLSSARVCARPQHARSAIILRHKSSLRRGFLDARALVLRPPPSRRTRAPQHATCTPRGVGGRDVGVHAQNGRQGGGVVGVGVGVT